MAPGVQYLIFQQRPRAPSAGCGGPRSGQYGPRRHGDHRATAPRRMMIVTKDLRPGRTSILKRKAPGRPVGNTGAQTRERIVQTAAAMFALQGLQNVSLNQVAGACGLTAPAIYNYFPSKDALYVEMKARIDRGTAQEKTDQAIRQRREAGATP